MPDTDVVASSPDVQLVRELAAVLNETGLSEIEMDRGDLRIRVAKHAQAPRPTAYAPTPDVDTQPTPASPEPPPRTEAAGEIVKSPMVGTVYMQAQPGAAPFARKGDRVSKGQTLLLIEAMKTMNPIVATRDGVLVDILVADSQPVEYGEPLAVIA